MSVTLHIHTYDEAWVETKHPRASNGEFSSSGGGVTAGHKTALKHYTGAGFKAVNGHLVGGREADAATKQTISELDNLLDNASLPVATTVYRGTSSLATVDILTQAAGSLKKGQVLNLKGFTSSTLNSSVANNFASQSSKSLIIEMHLPKGANAMDISDHSDVGKSESEVLIARNSRFKVVSFKKPNKLVVEMMPNESKKTTTDSRKTSDLHDDDHEDRFNWESGAGITISGDDDGEILVTAKDLGIKL